MSNPTQREEKLKQTLRSQSELLKEIKLLKESRAWSHFNEELNREYRNQFELSIRDKDQSETQQDKLVRTSQHIEKMKGVGYAISLLDDMVVRIEDDIEHIKTEIEFEEAGE